MHTKSAVKRLATSKAANLRNRTRINSLKTLEKKLRSAVAAGNADDSKNLLKDYFSKLDKVAKVGTIHGNKVANKKSQLSKLVNTVVA
ncbi:MAG: 30S ribosomal protein S20 [Lentisphaeria bacterium]|nr:30S ribosomal protein S20 [Lentisphaeria bacterium]